MSPWAGILFLLLLYLSSSKSCIHFQFAFSLWNTNFIMRFQWFGKIQIEPANQGVNLLCREGNSLLGHWKPGKVLSFRFLFCLHYICNSLYNLFIPRLTTALSSCAQILDDDFSSLDLYFYSLVLLSPSFISFTCW